MKNMKDAETKGGKDSAFAPTGIMAPLDGPAEEVANDSKDAESEKVEKD